MSALLLGHHAKCDTRFGGSRTSHCMRCCQTFTTPANFDRHQKGDECVAPESVGLVLSQRVGYAAWMEPGSDWRDGLEGDDE